MFANKSTKKKYMKKTLKIDSFFIRKCDGFITKCNNYYKMRRSLQIATVQMFYNEFLWSYQDFKNENLLFKSALDTGPVTRDHVKSSQMRNETPLKLYRLFFAGIGIIFLCFRDQIHPCS